MNDAIHKTLVSLKDVQGTRGSFVLDADGQVLAMEMPSMFDLDAFQEMGPRIERLAESFSTLGDEMESCLVRFSDHLLSIKRFPKGGALCILSDSSVSLPALRMALNLAHKKLAPEVATAHPLVNGTKVPETMPSAVPPPSAPAAAAPSSNGNGASPGKPAAKAARYYRGHLVED